ncbi:hypothetical protein SAMN05444008_105175 [Cnuella takakiae]|uniref:Uncharacterized protein n=1 Tax=Cnuella takakiae TaxID=1302690 RepID=A0A1M4ZCQ2_9BACT|nr:hypothetical protein SAMN05444008_105175 [Cnuella takakiae]
MERRNNSLMQVLYANRHKKILFIFWIHANVYVECKINKVFFLL